MALVNGFPINISSILELREFNIGFGKATPQRANQNGFDFFKDTRKQKPVLGIVLRTRRSITIILLRLI